MEKSPQHRLTDIHLQLSAPAVESWQSSTLTSPVPPAKRLAQPAANRILTKSPSRQSSGGSTIVFEKGERFSIRQDPSPGTAGRGHQ
ncbi:hypothetical protein PABG_12308 [Paracoccidioides brasiliensis Pb03]|nr:hypothetical protein PABG_12308 [Paracoccidioides brasiliensis Pb03]